MRSVSIIFCIALLFCGCSLANPRLYEGAERPPSEESVVSALGVYEEAQLSLQITAIDGQSVDTQRSASFHVLPKVYRVTIHVQKDLRLGSAPTGGLQFTWKEADVEATLDARPGHTYVPIAAVHKNRIAVSFEDKGERYPQECLPLYRLVNKSSNPGHMLYKDGRRCGI